MAAATNRLFNRLLRHSLWAASAPRDESVCVYWNRLKSNEAATSRRLIAAKGAKGCRGARKVSAQVVTATRKSFRMLGRMSRRRKKGIGRVEKRDVDKRSDSNDQPKWENVAEIYEKLAQGQKQNHYRLMCFHLRTDSCNRQCYGSRITLKGERVFSLTSFFWDFLLLE